METNQSLDAEHPAMNQPKLTTPVDAERLVRGFLDAFNSLKAITAPPAYPAPAEDERPAQLQDRSTQAFGLAGSAVSIVSAEPPEPANSVELWTQEDPDIDEEEAEQILSFQGEGNSESSDCQSNALKTQHEVIEEFCADHEVLERLHVTPVELRALSRVSMLGVLTCKQDLLFILRQIREAGTRPESREIASLEPIEVPAPVTEPSIPEITEMSERIRLEALEKLAEEETQNAAERRGAPWRRFNRILNRRKHSSRNCRAR